MAEGHGGHGCVLARGRGEWRHHCWNLRVDPEFVVKTLHQLQAWFQMPRELREDLVLFVSSWELRVGARLTVVVAQVLIAAKEPESIATHGTTEVRREVAVPGPFVPALRLAGRNREHNRLPGQPRRLPVVRRVVEKMIASLSGDDVENGTLNIAVLGRDSHGLDLNFLNDVDARLGTRDAGAGAGEIGAVDQKQVFVAAGPERGHSGHR